MVLRITLGILAVVFLPLGLVFTIVGLTVDQPDSGRPEDFLYTGAGLGLAGVALLVGFLVLRGREAARRRRRQEGLRTTAEVVRVQLKPGVRVGSLVALDLTVRFAAAGTADGTVSRMMLVSPLSRITEGEPVEIMYDPAEPSNFELAAGGGRG